MLPYYSHTAPGRESDLVKQEYDPQFCREGFVLKGGAGSTRKVILGTLLATVILAGNIAVAAAANAGNTGDGVLTLADPAYTSAVQEGVYTVTCTTGGADGTSKFRVEAPDGKTVGTATGGAAFAKHVKFTIAGGATDFVEGDVFEVLVSKDQEAENNTRVAWDPDADDDTGVISGVSLRVTEAPDGEDRDGGLSLDRGPAILSASAIQWPDGITAAKQAAGIEMLKKLNIIIR